EYDANKALIDKGNAPKNQLPALEAAVASAKAVLATAEAEADKSMIRSPIDGIIDTLPVQLGQAIQPGQEIATVLDPDPMLAVGSVSERGRSAVKLGQAVEVRFIDGSRREGKISYIGVSASKTTRTYPVESKIANPKAEIGDGVTCEMVVTTDPIEAVSVPRSALVFSDAGDLGVRVVDDGSRARFVAVQIIDDGISTVWLTGIDEPTRVIVVGQDFVKDGDEVDAVTIAATDDAGPPA
ncbi:MAG: efflux RND transporter periplasmic adaptor subunit, partial [Bauldia sp.]|nr:efflux RND transporter periplasmic adaptor subunit [Bauldia sp.]